MLSCLRGSAGEFNRRCRGSCAVRVARVAPEVAPDPALFLAAAILSSTNGPLDRQTVRGESAASIDALQPVARHKLQLETDPAGFLYALQNVAVFEDLGWWHEVFDGLANQEVELDCAAFGDHIYLELTDDSLLASLNPDDITAGTRLEPANLADLDPSQATLIVLADAHGQPQIQSQLPQAFGYFSCPSCGQRVRAVDTPA